MFNSQRPPTPLSSEGMVGDILHVGTVVIIIDYKSEYMNMFCSA